MTRWYLALLGCQFPGSFLPFGQEQIVRCATPGFKLISSASGRLDYIETINQWSARIGEPGFDSIGDAGSDPPRSDAQMVR